MTLVQNEFGELYNPSDFEPRKPLRIKTRSVGQIRADELRMAWDERSTVCAWCGKRFLPKRPSDRHCSPICQARDIDRRRRR